MADILPGGPGCEATADLIGARAALSTPTCIPGVNEDDEEDDIGRNDAEGMEDNEGKEDNDDEEDGAGFPGCSRDCSLDRDLPLLMTVFPCCNCKQWAHGGNLE